MSPRMAIELSPPTRTEALILGATRHRGHVLLASSYMPASLRFGLIIPANDVRIRLG